MVLCQGWFHAVAPLMLAFCLADATAFGGDRRDDPIEGKWFGMVGFPQDRVELGLEFRLSDTNELKAYLYQPVMNFYGLELPGTVNKEGEIYTNSESLFRFTLWGDKLEGTYFILNAPAQLERTEKLPAEVPLPELARGPEPKWQTKLGGAIYGTAELRENIAYVGSTNGMFYAVDSRDGKIVWTFVAGRPLHGTAATDENAIYFVCDNGFLFKLDCKSGREIWRYDLGDSQTSRVLVHPATQEFDWDMYSPRPLLGEGFIFVGSGDGAFHAVDAISGQRVWRFSTMGKIRGTATFSGPHVIFGNFDGILYAVDRKSGVEAWRRETRAPLTSNPVCLADRLVVGNRGGGLYAMNPANGEILWRLIFWGSAVESTAVPYDNLFYIGSSDLRRVSAVDPADGTVKWRTDVFGWAWGRPAVTGKAIYVGTVGGDPYEIRHLGALAALDRKSGRILWRWPMPQWPGSLVNGFAASPVLVEESLIIGGLDGSLYSFPIQSN